MGNQIIQSIKTIAQSLVDNAGYDKTRGGFIVGVNTVTNTYSVKVDGVTYPIVRAVDDVTYNIGDVVKVVIPCNQATQMYISSSVLSDNSLGNKIANATTLAEDANKLGLDNQTDIDSLNDTIFGIQTFEYVLNGVTIPVYRREDGTYYYILNDEEITVAEADLVHDSYGELTSYQEGGIYEDLNNITNNIETIDTKVNSFDARETAIYDVIADNSLIARKNARVEENSLIITNDTTTQDVANMENYLQLNSDSIIIYSNTDPAVTIGIAVDEDGEKVGGYMEMKGTSLFIAQESRLSTIRLRSAEKVGKLALVAGSDGHVSLREVLD